ncbi:hypothetical protein [Agrobacterium tumefaciens]|jgi:hypothetical protein|uniref:Uncharacterized protein n=1 Tax=Agrobacterium tumefaciens TaxID=358 RepID=A0AAP9E9C2_AGRTU|nr:hypothetical protein [Agrobacterium tumefaciens]MBP2573663.1 hypothetical protein [Agrobacterium tumefaciens]MCW8060305.1 hypothetical protein [Agrobacterium tumefaciens]MCW8147093.1 hypothetical protein [Agrobacterium tumefaciens]NSZ61295.1 hypothetical protein [Agrobacterium tumefaciens]NTA50790.1 hypothetical protein [Agrobacterium tumefaciens]
MDDDKLEKKMRSAERASPFRYLEISTIGSFYSAFLSVGVATAMPADITAERLLNICEAPTVQAAMIKGDEFGWPRLTDAETEEWRRSFVAYNGGSVDVVGWRHEKAGGAESLSFWVAIGPNGHKACAYSTLRPAGFLDALSERLGAPDNLDKNDAIKSTTAWWKRGAVEYSFVQVGSSAVINIGSSQ